MRAPDTALPLLAEGLGYAAGGVAILRDVSLLVEAGPPLLVIGPNGAGKSVLLRLLHGLLAPTAGRLRWLGPAPKRDAMVFQRPVMLRRSAIANLDHALALAGVARAERRAR
ncbi:ATP-binding cassette domain-containing protein, partial [Paracraurococcus ruber]